MLRAADEEVHYKKDESSIRPTDYEISLVFRKEKLIMKHVRIGLILILFAALLLVACGGGEETTETPDTAETTETTETETSTETGAEKITLRLWSHQNAAFQEGNNQIIAKFMEQNPDIEVTYETFEYDLFIQTLQTSMPAGTEADVIEMFGTWVCSYAEGGRLLPMPTSVMSYGQAQDMFFQAPLDGYYCDGELYGLPQEFNLENGGALVNPALFEAHGIAYPPNWDSFDGMITDAAQMSEFDGDVMTRAGFNYVTGDGLPFALLAAILQQGGSYFADDGQHYNFDSDETRNAIQLLVDIAQEDKVVDPVLFNDDSNWVGDSFFAGNVAIGFVGSWAAGEGQINFPDMAFDYVEIPPYFGDENRFAADAGWGKVVSVNTEHPEAAWKLAQFMTAEQENALIWNSSTATIPAMKALVENPDELLAVAPFLEATFNLLPHGQYIGDLTDRDQLFYEIIYPHVLDALQGITTADEAAQNINTEANAMVDANQ
jgi:multiple sugar transport system substrate-binding protein